MLFAMTNQPPTKQEIEQEREGLEKKVEKLKRVALVIALVHAVAITGAAAIAAVGVVALAGTGAVALVAALVNAAVTGHIDESLKDLNALTPFPVESPKACQDNAECDTYRQAVVQQGRALVMGEVKAMILYKISEQRGAAAKE